MENTHGRYCARAFGFKPRTVAGSAALERHEGQLAANGALCVNTGKRTGRSPQDRFIVNEPSTSKNIHWGHINQPFAVEKFTALWQSAQTYIQQHEHFIAHVEVGADKAYALPVTVITETAWHSLFANCLFIASENQDPDAKNRWTILSVPGLYTTPEKDATHSDGVILLNFAARKILIRSKNTRA